MIVRVLTTANVTLFHFVTAFARAAADSRPTRGRHTGEPLVTTSGAEGILMLVAPYNE